MSVEYNRPIETVVAPILSDKRSPGTNKLELHESYNQQGLFKRMRANTRVVGFKVGTRMATFSTPGYYDSPSLPVEVGFNEFDLYNKAASVMENVHDAWIVAFAPWWNDPEIPPLLHYLYQTGEKPLPAYHSMKKPDHYDFVREDAAIIKQMRRMSGKSIFMGTNVTPGTLEGKGGQSLHGPHSQRGALKNDVTRHEIQQGRTIEDWGDNGVSALLGKNMAQIFELSFNDPAIEITPDNRGVSFFVPNVSETEFATPWGVENFWRFPAQTADTMLNYYHSLLFTSKREKVIENVQQLHSLNKGVSKEHFAIYKKQHLSYNFTETHANYPDPIFTNMRALLREKRLRMATGYALTWQFSDEGVLGMVTFGIANDRDFGAFEALPFRKIERQSETASQSLVEKQFQTADTILYNAIFSSPAYATLSA